MVLKAHRGIFTDLFEVLPALLPFSSSFMASFSVVFQVVGFLSPLIHSLRFYSEFIVQKRFKKMEFSFVYV